MFNRSASRLGFYALLPLLMVFSACSGGNSGAGSEPMASVGINLAPVNNDTAQSKSERRAPKTENITLLTIDVQDADGNELARESAKVEPGTTVTLTLNVPVGVNRIFKAEAFDEAGQVILFGNAVTDLQEGIPVVLTIPVEAPLLISPENPVIDTDTTQTFTATRSPLLSDSLQWTVDGILNGDAQVGTITAIDDLTAEYTAPASVPGAAQVDVRVESTLDPELYFDETQAVINDPAKTLFVDPINGVDSDTCGAEADKCKTLTQALFLAEAGGTVLLEPGTYFFDDGPENETLPLQMKTGVTIHGTTQHGIAFLDFTDPEISGRGILGADNATLSGMRIETHFSFGDVIDTNGTSPTIQDNLFFGGCDLMTDQCNSTAIFVDQSSAPNIFGNTFGEIEGPRSFLSAVHLEGQATPQIIDNNFTGNWVGLQIQGDAAPRIENNRILENREGVVVGDNALPDLGGGTSDSAGLNILSCNSEVDLFNDTSNDILAQRNQWDHDLPDTFSTPGDGADIVFIVGLVDSSDATLYPFAPCNFGVQVTVPSPNFTTEGGGPARFDVVLGTEPSADVVIVLSSNDTSEGMLSINSLTFTNQNWNIPQTVTVIGQNDDVADGSVSYKIEFDLSGSLDLAYQQSEPPAPIDLFNTDDETPGITVSAASDLQTTEENNGTAKFSVRLNARPTGEISITMTSSKVNEGTVSSPLVFKADDTWNDPKEVTVTGVDDEIDDENQGYEVSFSVSGPGYDAVTHPPVGLINIDNDTAGITILQTSDPETTEGGGMATFDVTLDSEPTEDVVIVLQSSNLSEGRLNDNGDPLVLSFPVLDWRKTESVTVTGQNDDVADIDQEYSISLTVDEGDTKYLALPPSVVNLINRNDDLVGVKITETSQIPLMTTENQNPLVEAKFTVELESEPTGPVMITITGDASEGSMDRTSILFDQQTLWNDPQTVIITGVDDDVDDNDQSYDVIFAVSGADYKNVVVQALSVTNIDNDRFGIRLSRTFGLLTDEDGRTDTFTVVLDSEPMGDPRATVTIGLSSNDLTEGSVSPRSLSFDASNWSTPQPVTVTGVDDVPPLADGPILYDIVTAPASSSDPNYDKFNAENVRVTNIDTTPQEPDLVVTALSTIGTAIVNQQGNVEALIRVVIKNQGGAEAVIFKVSTHYTGGVKPGVVPFSVPGQTSSFYPFTSGPLAPGAEVTFSGMLTFNQREQDATVFLNAIADSCFSDELVSKYCRVNEANEENNVSVSVPVMLTPSQFPIPPDECNLLACR